MMASRAPDDPPLTEPLVISCLYINGIEIESEESALRFVGWVKMPSIGGETEERRIAVRFTMTMRASRQMLVDLRKRFPRSN